MTKKVVIVGAGFTGLSMGIDLARHKFDVTIYEKDHEIGGLASSFETGGQKLERFYHHWFTNDHSVMKLIKDLGKDSSVRIRDTNTGMYYANNFYRLSSPIDLLKFKPLSLLNRIRLGLLALRARRVKNWMQLEALSAADWLRSMAGDEVYKVVWEPLLRGKFGEASEQVSAVWMWNKLKLRGGSRSKNGDEQLAYYKGGFSQLIKDLHHQIDLNGGRIECRSEVQRVLKKNGKVCGVEVGGKKVDADIVIITTPLPLAMTILDNVVPQVYFRKLSRIQYLSNICFVLELNKSLSSTYWLNVNDPSFPFVAVIEHTNFEDKSLYNNNHIVYLSKYLPATDKLYNMSNEDAIIFALKNLKRMFKDFDESWIEKSYVWRADYSQPIVEKNFSSMIPSKETGVEGLYVNSMAQIYPEDRGTNYAIREGRSLALEIVKKYKC